MAKFTTMHANVYYRSYRSHCDYTVLNVLLGECRRWSPALPYSLSAYMPCYATACSHEHLGLAGGSTGGGPRHRNVLLPRRG